MPQTVPAGTNARHLRLVVWPSFLLIVAVAVSLCVYFSRFALIDDAFIAFRYVRNLLHGHGLVFNVGERTEGYTCFLWVALLCLSSGLGISRVLASQVLGSAFLLLTLAALARFFPTKPARPAWSRLLAPALLALDSACAMWAVRGLETTMFMFLLTMAIRLDGRDHAAEPFIPGWSGVWYGLAALTRPEGALIFAMSLAFWAASKPRLLLSTPPWRHVLHFAAVVIPHAIWRLFYYGDLLPNTYYAKTGISLSMLVRGADYFVLFWGTSGTTSSWRPCPRS